MAYINFSNENERVKNLQETLRRFGILTDNPEFMVGVDGNFDEATRKAVTDFQKINGIKPTGIPDNDTWSRLQSNLRIAEAAGGSSRPISIFPLTRTIFIGEISDLVQIIQIMLSEIGILQDFRTKIPINGVYDTSTANAVKEFQNNTGIPVTGTVDLPTWNRLAIEFNNTEQ